MAAAQQPLAHWLGAWGNSPSTGTSTFSLNSAGNAAWIAYSFVLSKAETLNAVRQFLTGVSGSLTAANLTCEIQTDNGSGAPSGTAVTGGTAQPCAATPASGWNDWTGFTAALSANTLYWRVFKNANGTPTSNFATFAVISGGNTMPQPTAGSGNWGWCSRTTTTSGGAWGAAVAGGGIGRLAFADSTYAGIPLATEQTEATHIDGTNEIGVQFTLPGNQEISVAGIGMYAASRNSTPGGNLLAKLYTGSAPSVLASTGGVPSGLVTAANWLPLYFTGGPQTLTGGTVITLTMADSAGETGTNYFRAVSFSFDTDANSLALLPYQGTAKKALWNGSTWTYTTGTIVPLVLLLDTNGDFPTVAAGPTGGLLEQRLWLGGLM